MRNYIIHIEGFKVTFRVPFWSREEITPKSMDEKLLKYYRNYVTSKKMQNAVMAGRYTAEMIPEN